MNELATTTTFTPVASGVGGILIGLAAALLLLSYGRIAGISGIAGGLFSPQKGDVGWRIAFVAGLVLSGTVAQTLAPGAFANTLGTTAPILVLAGLLVGFGTRLGSGCTSGHGVCGIGRLSPRSLIATLTFIMAGAATVGIARHLLGLS